MPKKMFFNASIAVFCMGLLLSFMLPLLASADEFPSKPIKLILPYAPGGSHDAHGRAFCGVANEYFGVPVLAVIKAGGGTSIAANYVAKSKPDGYTLILGCQKTVITRALLKPDLPYSYDSFVAIGRINYSPMMVAVHADSPFDSLRDLMDYAQEHPNEISCPMAFGGGVDQLTLFPLFIKAGVEDKIKMIPIHGGGPQLKAFLSRDVHFGVWFPSVIKPYIESGKIKVLAVCSAERVARFPEIPTMIEQGYEHQFAMFRAIFGPKGIPAPRLKKLRKCFEQTVKSKSFQSIVERMGAGVIYMSGEEFQKFMPAEIERIKLALKAMLKKKK